MTDDTPMERIDLPQTRGPLVRFTGRLIAETEHDTRGARLLRMVLQIWETQGGAYIAYTDAQPREGGFPDQRATVVKPIDDEQAMKMARKQLGWSFVEEVE